MAMKIAGLAFALLFVCTPLKVLALYLHAPIVEALVVVAQSQGSARTDSLSMLERQANLEKTRLEIEGLKDRHAWYKPWLDAAPLITAVLTIAALSAGAYRYFHDNQETRSAQRNTQIRSDIDVIVSFPSDRKISLARIIFLFHDLVTLTAKDKKAHDVVTDVIEKLVADDLDFDKLRDVGFDVVALASWPGYAQRLEQQGGSPTVIYKYLQAFHHLYPV
jgi:hypothetical protein